MPPSDHSLFTLDLHGVMLLDVPTLQPNQSLMAAIAQLQQQQASNALLVMAETALIGIVTQRDLLRGIGAGLDIATATVAEVMRQPVVTYPETALDQVAAIVQIFATQDFSHLPIVSATGQVVGLLTRDRLGDLLQRDVLNQYLVKQLLDSVTAGLILLRLYPDRRLQYDYISPYCAEIFGYSAEALLANPELWRSHIHPEDWANVIRPIMTAILQQHTAAAYQAEYRFQRPDETTRWLLAQIHVQWLDHAGYWQLTVVDTDVSDRHQIQATLHNTYNQYLALTQAVPVGIFRSNLAGEIIYINQRWTEITDLNFEESLGFQWLKAVHPDWRDRLINDWQQIIAEGNNHALENCLQMKDGSLKWVYCQAQPEKDDQGRIVGYVGTLTDITQQKQLELALRESEAELQQLFAAMTDAVFVIDRHGSYRKILTINSPNLYRPSEVLLNQTFDKIFPPAQAQFFNQCIQQTFTTGRTQICKYTLPIREQERWFTATCSVLTADTVLWVARDITDLHHAQEALRESAEELQGLFAAMDDVVTILDSNGTYLKVIPTNTDKFHCPPETMIGQNIADCFTGETLALFQHCLQKTLQTRQSQHFEYCLPINGVETWFDATCSLIAENRLLWIARDTTALHQAQTALRESAKELQGLFAAMDDVVIVVDREERYLKMIPTNTDKFYCPPDALINKTLADIFTGDTLALFRRYMQKTIQTRQSQRLEYALLIDGVETWFEASCSLIAEDRVLWVARDISDRHRAEAALRASEYRYLSLVSNVPVGLFRHNLTGDLIYLNERACEISGLTPAIAYGSGWRTALHPEDRTWVIKSWFEAWRGDRPFHCECRFQHGDGTIRWVYIQMIAEQDNQGNKIGFVGTLTDISDRKHVEQQVEQQEERWQLALTANNDGIWDWHITEDRIFYSDRCLEMLGYTAAEHGVTAADRLALVHPADRDTTVQAIDAHLHHQTPFYSSEHRVRCQDGSYKWILDRGQALWDEAGEAVRMVGSYTDITERKEAEEKLRHSETALLEAQAIAHIGSWEFDVLTGKITWSPELFRMYGLDPSQAAPSEAEYWARIHPEDRPQLEQCRNEAIAAGKNYTLSFRVILPDGSIHYHEGRGRVVKNAAGEVIRLYGTSLDNTERMAAEQALRESEARWQFALEGSGDGIWDWDAQTNKVFFSRQWKAMLGYDEAEVGDTLAEWDSRVHPDDKADVYAKINQHFQGETPIYQSEHRVLCKDGSYKWILDRGKVIKRTPDGQPLRVIGTHTDISDRKRTELHIQEISQRLALATNSANIGIWDFDIVHNVLLWDEQMYQLYGIPPEEFIGAYAAWQQGLHPEDRSVTEQQLWAAIAGQGEFHTTFRVILPNGEIRHIEAHAIVLRDENQQATRMIGVNWDISDRHRAEQELIRAKEEAETAALSKSMFLANMSHEIRTPMNGVIGMLNLLLDTPLTPEQRSQAEIAQASAESLLSLINDILDFSKVEAGKLDLEQVDFDLLAMVGSFAKTVALSAQEKGLDLIFDLQGIQQPYVQGDPGRLRQILTNLVSNAIKFTEQGEILIRCNLQPTETGLLLFTGQVIDTGIGIPDDKLQDLFNPFTQLDASTTRKYGGTGLGLAITTKLCQLMGGDIRAESLIDRGTCFTFTVLLRSPHNPPPVQPLHQLRQPQDIIVVEEHPTHRQIVCDQLRHWGATVQEAVDGQTAIALWDSYQLSVIRDRGMGIEGDQGVSLVPSPIILSDRSLQDMDVYELAHQLRQRTRHPFKLVVMTALTHHHEDSQTVPQQVDAYLTKPIMSTELWDCCTALQQDIVIAHHLTSPSHSRLSVQQNNGMAGDRPTAWSTAHLLLVEDNKVNQMVILGLLKKLGLTADTAFNGVEALRKLNQASPDQAYDLILMDCLMPEMDGYETSQRIRQGEGGDRHKQVPIIALTANAMKGDREKCLEAGMDDYLSKPIAPSAMQQILNNWLTTTTHHHPSTTPDH